MKLFSFTRFAALTAACVAFLTANPFSAFAQPPADTSSILNSAMFKLFGNISGFTARAEIRVEDKHQKETQFVPLGFAFLDGKRRMELDVTQFKGSELDPAVLNQLKALGMESWIVVTRPDKKATLSIYPKVKAYAEVAMTRDEAAATAVNYELKKTRQGKETVDGHACEKNKSVLTGDGGQKVEALTWNASDLKDFPVKIQLVDKDTTVIINFKDIKLARPDAAQFDAPAGMTKFETAEALIGDRINSVSKSTQPK